MAADCFLFPAKCCTELTCWGWVTTVFELNGVCWVIDPGNQDYHELIGSHTARKTFICLAYEKGMDIEMIKAIYRNNQRKNTETLSADFNRKEKRTIDCCIRNSVIFYIFKKNAIETVHIKIRTNTKRGKHLLGLLREMAKTGRDIEFEHIPNDETIEAINDARAKKGMKAKNVDDLFAQLEK